MKNVLIAISIIIASLILGGVAMLQSDRFIELQARYDCGQMYRKEYVDETTNTKIVSPIEDEYKKCVSEVLNK